MSFDAIPEDREESYPCECGGEIKKYGELWECDNCEWKSNLERLR